MTKEEINAAFERFNSEEFRGKFVIDATDFPNITAAVPYIKPVYGRSVEETEKLLGQSSKHRILIGNSKEIKVFGVNKKEISYLGILNNVFSAYKENSIFYGVKNLKNIIDFKGFDNCPITIPNILHTLGDLAPRREALGILEDLINADIPIKYMYYAMDYDYDHSKECSLIERTYRFSAKNLRKFVKKCQDSGYNISPSRLKNAKRYHKILSCSMEELVEYSTIELPWYLRYAEDIPEVKKEIKNYLHYSVKLFPAERYLYRDYYTIKSNNKILLKNFPLFPKDTDKVKYFHDEATNLLNKQREEAEIARNKDNQKLYEEKYYKNCTAFEYSDKDFSIIACKDLIELTREGRALSHCVGSYINSVANGYDKILFLRRNSELDKPFFTINLDTNNKVRQIHGKCNCDITEEITPFLKSWANKFNLSLKNVSGVYCAINS